MNESLYSGGGCESVQCDGSIIITLPLAPLRKRSAEHRSGLMSEAVAERSLHPLDARHLARWSEDVAFLALAGSGLGGIVWALAQAF